MKVVWMIAGIGIVGAFATLLARLRGRGRDTDLGFVSHQWVVEHRSSYASDRQM
jgi:hypothetical protein